ncbi:MAG: DUF2111 domain-containing protein [Euryarchaeota archaeon]|nr:DUF2111 domain-containing protein [Euryarchaeota archaeon]MBU4608688.1 DUF2111 domain-containing protein [Euryarchaeota archaeon]MBV1730181.1 DUF2111 domain-containing protein [Methanobacterium sp.]MBV1755053.1 DUF2111 domain-containing protein [Methanobacterium sp.]MBV1768438.1 DUF2111 domain-containing protein [Methanobacterium sp.]
MNITLSSTGKELAEIGLSIHQLVDKLPLTMRSKESRGIRIEDGKVLEYDYTGPALEEVLSTGKIFKGTPDKGPYAGTPVVVVPLKDEGQVICAIGLVDITQGLFSDMVEISRRPEEVKKDVTRGEFY